MVISRSREDVTRLQEKLRFENDIIPLQDSVNILGVKTDSSTTTFKMRYIKRLRR